MNYFVLFSLIAIFAAPVASQQCQICEQIVTFIENWIENNESITAIEQYLEIVCTLAPDTWQQPCDALVDYGIEEAIQWLEENENATALCSQLELCSSKAKTSKLLSKPKSMPADANCDICIQVIGVIENWVESNYTIEEITEYLDQICSLIPGFFLKFATKLLNMELHMLSTSFKTMKTQPKFALNLDFVETANPSKTSNSFHQLNQNAKTHAVCAHNFLQL